MTSLPSRLATATTPIPDSFFSTLLSASHILHHHALVDGYGHISARSPQDAGVFFLSRALAPALVSSRADLVAYRVADGEPVDATESRRGFLERYIHSEAYRRFPGVRSVVHGHAEDLLAFAVAPGVPLRVVAHMGGVLGAAATPVWDIADHYGAGDRRDLLVANARLGAKLAEAFEAHGGLVAKAGGVIRGLLPGAAGGDGAEKSEGLPEHKLVLMRGHGFTAVGDGVEEVVYRAVYAAVNARVQYKAITLQGAANMAALGERVGRVGKEGYEAAGDKTKLGEVKYLSDREVKDAWEANKGQAKRAWDLWVEEVRNHGLYRNEYWEEEEEDTPEKA